MIGNRIIRVLAGALLLAAAAGTAIGQGGVRSEVVRVNPPQPVATGERIEVIEFFYYGCPICYELQPHLSRWLATQAPDYVTLRRVPALSSENWEHLAKLYYALESLDEIARLHWPIYDNYHFDGVALGDEKVMLDWVGRNGVDRKAFADAYASAQVRAKLEQSRELMKAYDVRGVPTVVVDGKYLSSARLANGARPLVQLVDELVRRARRERPK